MGASMRDRCTRSGLTKMVPRSKEVGEESCKYPGGRRVIQVQQVQRPEVGACRHARSPQEGCGAAGGQSVRGTIDDEVRRHGNQVIWGLADPTQRGLAFTLSKTGELLKDSQ